MTPEEKRLLIELAIVALSEASPDAQRRITKLFDQMEDADRSSCKGFEVEPGVYSGCDQSAGDCPTCGK